MGAESFQSGESRMPQYEFIVPRGTTNKLSARIREKGWVTCEFNEAGEVVDTTIEPSSAGSFGRYGVDNAVAALTREWKHQHEPHAS